MSIAEGERRAEARAAGAGPSHAVLLAVVILATIAVQFVTLSYYFYNDDYLPFSEIVAHGSGDYTWRLLTSTDVTPNWRPLPGLLYLASYDVAGMNPLPVHVVMLATHAASAALLYYAVWRVSGRTLIAAAMALVFGLNPAYVGALSQVTTATLVMAAFFLLATLVACIECALAEDARRARAWLAAAVVLFLLTIGSHEGMAIMFPVFALVLYTFDRHGEGRIVRAGMRSLPLAALGCATALAFWACGCNEGSSVWGTHYAWNQTLIYGGRLLYPVGLEGPTHVGAAHATAAAVLVGVVAVVCVRGPAIGRIGAAWLALALAPYVFVEYATAGRYVYLATPGLVMVAASAAMMIADAVPASRRMQIASVALSLFVALCGWYWYETVRQNRAFDTSTGTWRAFHSDVTRVFPRLPEGAHVVIIGGPFQEFQYQYYVLPAFAETTWGRGVTLQSLVPGSEPARSALASKDAYVAEYRQGRLVRVGVGAR